MAYSLLLNRGFVFKSSNLRKKFESTCLWAAKLFKDNWKYILRFLNILIQNSEPKMKSSMQFFPTKFKLIFSMTSVSVSWATFSVSLFKIFKQPFAFTFYKWEKADKEFLWSQFNFKKRKIIKMFIQKTAWNCDLI